MGPLMTGLTEVAEMDASPVLIFPVWTQAFIHVSQLNTQL